MFFMLNTSLANLTSASEKAFTSLSLFVLITIFIFECKEKVFSNILFGKKLFLEKKLITLPFDFLSNF